MGLREANWLKAWSVMLGIEVVFHELLSSAVPAFSVTHRWWCEMVRGEVQGE